MGLLKELPVPGENKKGWPWQKETKAEFYKSHNNWPRISVVVPSYKQGEFIEETLRSILLQNYPALEIIIIDGGSKDETLDVIKKYQPWISYWVSEKDKGQSDAINKGFNKATGDIVTWLCSDDLFTEGALNKAAKLFSELPDDVGLIYGGTVLFGKNFKSKRSFGYEYAGIERYIAGQAFPQPSSFFKGKYLHKAGAWVREDLHLGMDYDLFARLACVCKFYSVTEIFSLYRLHADSKTVSQHSRLVEDWTRTFGNLCRNFGWHEIIKKMEVIPQLSIFLDYHYPLQADQNIISKVNRELTLFYHLCYWIKSCYYYGRREDARKLLDILKKNYPAEMLKKEKNMLQIMRRLKLPNSVLDTLVTLKAGYKKLVNS